MVVEAHKVLKKKRRQRHKHFLNEQPKPAGKMHNPHSRPSIIDIFKFLSEEVEDYSTVIKRIGERENGRRLSDCMSRSKSCNDILAIETLDRSPRHRRVLCISEVFINQVAAKDADEIQESSGDPKPAECRRRGREDNAESCAFGSDDGIVISAGPDKNVTEEESAQLQLSTGGTRFTICKVAETDLLLDKDEKG